MGVIRRSKDELSQNTKNSGTNNDPSNIFNSTPPPPFKLSQDQLEELKPFQDFLNRNNNSQEPALSSYNTTGLLKKLVLGLLATGITPNSEGGNPVGFKNQIPETPHSGTNQRNQIVPPPHFARIPDLSGQISEPNNEQTTPINLNQISEPNNEQTTPINLNQISEPNNEQTTPINLNQISEPHSAGTTIAIPKEPSCQEIISGAMHPEHFDPTIIDQTADLFCKFPPAVLNLLLQAIEYNKELFPDQFFIEFEDLPKNVKMGHRCISENENIRKGKLCFTEETLKDVNSKYPLLDKITMHELFHHILCLTSKQSDSSRYFIPQNGDADKFSICAQYFQFYINFLSSLSDNIDNLKTLDEYRPLLIKIADQWIKSNIALVEDYEHAVWQQEHLTLKLTLNISEQRKIAFVRYTIKQVSYIADYKSSFAQCGEFLSSMLSIFINLHSSEKSEFNPENIKVLIKLNKEQSNSRDFHRVNWDLAGFLEEEFNKYLGRFNDLINKNQTALPVLNNNNNSNQTTSSKIQKKPLSL